MNIRTATMADLKALAAVEAACFPAAEAATEADFAARLRVYPNHFWLLEEDGKVVSFVNGMVTDEPTIRDEMYADASLHREDGAWQAVFGVNTLPDYRRHFGTGASGYDAPFGLSDPQLDKAIADAERAHSPEERAAAMAKVDRLIAEQAVWLPGWKENLVLLACQHQVRFPDCEGCRFSTPAPYEIAEAHLYWIDPRHRPAGYEVERRYEPPPESAPEPSGPAPTALPPSP